MTRPTLIDLEPPVEKVFLVAVDTGSEDGWSAQDSLSELSSLALTAGADVVGAEWQNRRHIDPNWYVGKGKAEDLLAAKRETGFGTLVADDELSPAQQRSLEELLNVKVIDRSRLILDIFALHAQTHEGRLQVELAQLEYQLPRLTKLWTHLSRTQGGIGSRGPGESQLETDRRIIRTRISKMKERVEHVRQQRETAARGRDRRLWPTVGIVGYTNAGKSTLLNALVGSEVAKAEDKLFATLDPTSRQVKLGDGQTAIVTDTVGFIHKLPHQLVDAFRATLEEVNRADVLIEVVDASDPHVEEHRATVQTVLDELGAGDKPRLVAFNKADLIDRSATNGETPAPAIAGAVFVSALTGYGMDTLRAATAAVLASLWVDVDVTLPYAAGELLARVRERGTVDVEYRERDVRITGRVAPALAGELEAVAARWAEAAEVPAGQA
jgi:GTP-binding protein HflX